VLDEANWPITKCATVLNGRIYATVNSSNPSTVYASSIASGGAISWTSGNKTIEVFPNNGDGAITGISNNGRIILIFKERSFYRYDANQLDRVAGIGTTSHESIASDDRGVTYFFGQGANSVGFFATTGGYPTNISRPVNRWVKAISASFYDDIAAYTDGSKICWSVGSVTLDGTTYSNCCLVYNISDQTWETRNYADSFRVFSQYINGSNDITIVGGDTDGHVQTLDSGNTDNSADIVSDCEMRPLVFGNRAKRKAVPELYTVSTDFQGLRLHMKTDDGPFKEIGGIKQHVQRFTGLELKGSSFQPKITCSNSSTPYVFDGLVWSKIQDEGYAL
jgi:hypothetical protein